MTTHAHTLQGRSQNAKNIYTHQRDIIEMSSDSLQLHPFQNEDYT